MTLNIPGEVAREASAVSAEGPIGSTLEDMRMAGYQVIAEWARKEALREAEDAVRAVEVVEAIGWDNFPVDPEPFGDAVRALMENEF